MKWRGIYKLIEECGEVLQICGKLGPFPSGDHPDGGENLKLRLEKELVDLQAAITYVQSVNGLTASHDRLVDKLHKFSRWGLTGLSNDDQPARKEASEGDQYIGKTISEIEEELQKQYDFDRYMK